MLQPTAGGAAAKPFVTHHNALDRDLYLRIAPELHLKRLLVGGFERVYEIGRVFRNEGISTKHNPEFTMLETYQAYADYDDIMRLVEEMVAHAAQEVLGDHSLPYGDTSIDLTPPWRRLTLRDAILEHSGIDFEAHADAASLREAMVGLGVEAPAAAGRGKLIDELLSTFVEPKLIQPTFLLDYPVELSPLAKRKPDNPNLVERFEAFLAGRRDRQRLLRAQRPARPARAVRRAGPPARRRRRGGGDGRRGLPGGPGARHAPHRRPGHRHRPAGHGLHRPAVHPRRHPLPATAEQRVENG